LRFVVAPLAGWERVVFAGLAAVFPWLTILGGLGVCLEFIKGKGPVMRFLAEASFWVYLIHLPIVMLMQVLLLPIPWPGPVKFLVTSAVGATLSVLSYEYVTRYSLVGEIVNGARRRFRGKRRLGREFGWVAALGAVALVIGGSTWYLRVFLWQDNLHVVVPGQIYRCARLSPAALDRLIRREGLRSVITFSGESNRHLWIAGQKTYCQTRGVSYRIVSLRDDRLPPREQVQQLLALLEQCPKPIVVQGYRGLDHCGFASARPPGWVQRAIDRRGTPARARKRNSEPSGSDGDERTRYSRSAQSLSRSGVCSRCPAFNQSA
jgi:hypothetical protein